MSVPASHVCADPPAAPRVDRGDGAALLGRFAFVVPAVSPFDMPLPLLAVDGGAAAESWHCEQAGALGLVALREADSDDIEASAERAYRALLRQVRGSARPHLLRIWNFFPAINAGEGDGERYRRFCVGRARAVDAAFNEPPPAATAIGSHDPTDGLSVVALCARAPARALENPRQTPAWRYPRQYSPVAPGFSRGAVIGAGGEAALLASGTASIVGHVSRHIGDVRAQLLESLANLDALLEQGALAGDSRFEMAGCTSLRVYLRHRADLAAVRAALRERLPAQAVVRYLHGDICRRELDIELEGVFAAS